MRLGRSNLAVLSSVLTIWFESAYALSPEDVYLPRTDVHLKCQFSDGSYTEYKRREKWMFYAEVIPHAQTYAGLDESWSYVDVAGHRQQSVGPRAEHCQSVGKRNGRLFYDGGFENSGGKFVDYGSASRSQAVAPPWQKLPQAVPAAVADQTAVVREVMTREFLSGGYPAQIVPLNVSGDNELLFEQPLTASYMHHAVPLGTVLFVYQSTSSDYGQSWSVPVITKDSKLFEIGRKVGEQSWSPKLNMIVVPRHLRRKG